MKRTVQLFAITLSVMVGAVAFGHHAAEGIVDEEIYAMIDELVADTPHGSMDLTDLGGGMTEIVVDRVMVRELENMIDDGLLEYVSMLDGDVTVNISFGGPRDVSMTILQEE